MLRSLRHKRKQTKIQPKDLSDKPSEVKDIFKVTEMDVLQQIGEEQLEMNQKTKGPKVDKSDTYQINSRAS